MIENFFAEFNAYLLGHPVLLAKLKFLFWLKYWILIGLMAVFIYLLYKERHAGGNSPSHRPDALHTYTSTSFEA
ncbi:hypothetical protein [Methylococcus capsulatus]|uniref:hypothetical protein n=1 Tax=Methylococcus capsulatus TaxID=414 RepID=UPI0003097906|nr:hypothetical protein [Methylococcus capsulatus]QXP93392.1 hypothetical protein KW113_13720 [Methylococcus capsulatus]